MRIGLALPHYDYSFPDQRPATTDRVVAYAREAERLGFDSVWVSDHRFFSLEPYGGPSQRFHTPEALTMLAAIACGTQRVRLGSLVLCAPFRNAHVLAQQVRTIVDLSRGRLEVGLGAGWYEEEFHASSVPFGTTRERMLILERTLETVRDAGAPVFVGGRGGPRVMQIVANGADGWNYAWRSTPETYREGLKRLEKACAVAGRDVRSLRLTLGLSCLVGSDPADLEARYRAMQRWAPGGALDRVDLSAFRHGRLVGTPSECRARVADFEMLGVEEIVITLAHTPFAVASDDQLPLVSESLLSA